MNDKIVHVDGIGSVRVIKKRGIKNISISVKPFEGVRMSIPFLVSFDRAFHFLDQKKDWILKAQKRTNLLENNKSVFTEETIFNTKNHQLKIAFHNSKRVRVRINDEYIVIHFPTGVNISDSIYQDVVRKAIEMAWKIEANDLLPNKVKSLSEKLGFKYRSVKINKTKSRWGSCSVNNDISLSLYLMQLPDYLIDYIILHELCHIKVKNHQKEFWQLIDQLSNENARSFAKQLKAYKPGVF